MNESFRVGAVLLPKTLYKNVALVKYHLVSKLSQSRVLSSIILAVRFWNFCKLSLSVLLQPPPPKGKAAIEVRLYQSIIN